MSCGGPHRTVLPRGPGVRRRCFSLPMALSLFIPQMGLRFRRILKKRHHGMRACAISGCPKPRTICSMRSGMSLANPVTLCDGHGVFFVAASGQIRLTVVALAAACGQGEPVGHPAYSGGAMGRPRQPRFAGGRVCGTLRCGWGLRSRRSRDPAVREALSCELNLAPDGMLFVFPRIPQGSGACPAPGFRYEARCGVIDRGGAQQNDRVGNPAISDRLFHGTSLPGSGAGVTEGRAGGKQTAGYADIGPAWATATIGLHQCCHPCERQHSARSPCCDG